MGMNSIIGWLDRRHPRTGEVFKGATFNPWIGCTKISMACDLCYAWQLDVKRFSKTLGGATALRPISHWGKGAPRYRTSENYWKQPLKWNRMAKEAGIALAVFCGSLCDWADEEVPDDIRFELFELIDRCRNLDWLMLTKRPANARRWMAQFNPLTGPEPNIWMGATMETQKDFNARIDDLLAIPAVVHFASMEPLFERVDISRGILHPVDWTDVKSLDWVIGGGESCDMDPKRARPTHPDDATDLQAQCWSADIPFFWKQWGECAPAYELDHNPQAQAMCVMEKVERINMLRGSDGRRFMFRVGKHIAGNMLNGKKAEAMPRIRELTAA